MWLLGLCPPLFLAASAFAMRQVRAAETALRSNGQSASGAHAAPGSPRTPGGSPIAEQLVHVQQEARHEKLAR